MFGGLPTTCRAAPGGDVYSSRNHERGTHILHGFLLIFENIVRQTTRLLWITCRKPRVVAALSPAGVVVREQTPVCLPDPPAYDVTPPAPMGDEGAHPWKPSYVQASEENAKIAPSTRAECGVEAAEDGMPAADATGSFKTVDACDSMET